jgi:hypothetical protein
MESTQPMKTESGPGSPVDTSAASTRSGLVAATASAGSGNLPAGTTATMQNASPRTWKKQDLEELRLKAGLVAGALADFQAAGGLVVVKNISYPSPSGSPLVATKIYLVADGLDVKILKTADGLDFDIQPLPGGSLVAGRDEAA